MGDLSIQTPTLLGYTDSSRTASAMDTDIRLVREEGRGHSDSTRKSDYQLDWPDISELVSKLNFDLIF